MDEGAMVSPLMNQGTPGQTFHFLDVVEEPIMQKVSPNQRISNLLA